MSDSQFGHSQPVFQFLCPLDKLLSEEEPCGGVWGLLSGIAYFLTPAYEEEEVSFDLNMEKFHTGFHMLCSVNCMRCTTGPVMMCDCKL